MVKAFLTGTVKLSGADFNPTLTIRLYIEGRSYKALSYYQPGVGSLRRAYFSDPLKDAASHNAAPLLAPTP
jgi:hypothetical protein